MIAYGCVLPHAPLLLQAIESGKKSYQPALEHALQTVAEDLKTHQIDSLVCLSGHPRFQRSGFSCYISPACHINFKDLGDLTRDADMRMDWSVYTGLREATVSGGPLLHPIDEPVLDFGHAVPLWALLQTNQGVDRLRIACLNDKPASTPDEQKQFGRTLRQTLEASPVKHAVIVSSEYPFDADNERTHDDIRQRNESIRQAFFNRFAESNPAAPQLPVCSSGPFSIAAACFEDKHHWKYEELAFEYVSSTAFLMARIIPA